MDLVCTERNIGFLWKQSWNSSNRNARPHEATSSLISKAEPIPDVSTHQNVEPRAEERPLVEPTPLQGLDNKRPYIVSGSMLFATEKLLQAIPFDNSSILIVFAGEDQAFQGVIINKPISWNVFDNLEKDLETIKQAPLYYGGPVRAQGLPLVSLTRKPIEGFSKVIAGLYFGNPVITSMVIEGIKSEDRSARDYWFFLGYSSWSWDQLFDEVDEGAWHVSSQPLGTVDWPKDEES
ncbi:hypothetical protein HPP92_008403 [Vanilla planifolia]|uniref:Transcriptional regulator n=1 Tax=Vanilla planifolia TaxID=51239 RepID=A0A835V6C4_VANPL|nr:hypothetical protein HPP92_008403 [Vanilla planifolia]